MDTKAATLGTTLDSSRGIIAGVLHDCRATLARGLVVEVDGADERTFTHFPGSAESMQSLESIDGTYLIFNVPEGRRSLTARRRSDVSQASAVPNAGDLSAN
jgi:hypothetical protein